MYIDLVAYFFDDIAKAITAANDINKKFVKSATRITNKYCQPETINKIIYLPYNEITHKFLGEPEKRKIFIPDTI